MNFNQLSSCKILNHIENINDWINGKNPFAITTKIDLTNVCNHNCPGCVGGFRNNDYLTQKEIEKIILEISQLGGKSIILSGGGEPFCSPYILDTLSLAKLNNLDSAVITNGGLLHKFNSEEILNNCTWIRISIDAGNASIHKKTHNSDDFNKVISNIRHIVKIKEKIKSNCTIGIGYLTGEGTDEVEDMMDFVNLAIDLKVDYAQFRPFVKTNFKKNFSNFQKYSIDLNAFTQKSNSKTKIIFSEYRYDFIKSRKTERDYHKCYGQQFATTICASGDMFICCHSRGVPSMCLGNIKHESIKNIWFSEKRKRIVEAIDTSKCPLLCRADPFNSILWQIKNKKDHTNFI